MRKSVRIFVLSTFSITQIACADEQTEGQTSSVGTEEIETAISEDPVEYAPDEVEITKADTAKAENINFVVKNVNEPNIDRGGYSVTKPEDNQKYVAVQLWIKNTSAADINIYSDEFILYDQNDAEFVEVEAFTEHRKEPILFKDELILEPGETKSGWVTFTTDVESEAVKIRYDNITVKL